MAEFQYNNQSGQLGADLDSTIAGTDEFITGLFAIAPDFTTLGDGDYIKLVLDWTPNSSGINNPNFEIIYLVEYSTDSPLDGIITRGAEDATNWPPVAHTAATGTWACAPTVLDFAGLVWTSASITHDISPITPPNNSIIYLADTTDGEINLDPTNDAVPGSSIFVTNTSSNFVVLFNDPAEDVLLGATPPFGQSLYFFDGQTYHQLTITQTFGDSATNTVPVGPGVLGFSVNSNALYFANTPDGEQPALTDWVQLMGPTDNSVAGFGVSDGLFFNTQFQAAPGICLWQIVDSTDETAFRVIDASLNETQYSSVLTSGNLLDDGTANHAASFFSTVGFNSATLFAFAGNPNGNVVPNSAGDLCVDQVTPALWQAATSASVSWTEFGSSSSIGQVLSLTFNGSDPFSVSCLVPDGYDPSVGGSVFGMITFADGQFPTFNDLPGSGTYAAWMYVLAGGLVVDLTIIDNTIAAYDAGGTERWVLPSGGSIETITSNDNSVIVTDPDGPSTDLSVNAVQTITSDDGSITITNPTGPSTDLAVSVGTPGLTILRAFDFAYNTDNLDTGVVLYTPTIGDALIDAWVIIDTAWDGTTPQMDFQQFLGFPAEFHGWFSTLNGGSHLDATIAWSPIAQNDPIADFGQVVKLSSAGLIASPGTVGAVPTVFFGNQGLGVVVSQDGTITTQANVTADTPLATPVTITESVNDQFIWTSVNDGASPETFTIVPGVYDVDEMVAAINNAVGTTTPTFQSLTLTVNDPFAAGTVFIADNVPGTSGNGDTITEGNGGAAAMGFTSLPATLGGGEGGNPGSTQGHATLYLLTATPLIIPA